MSKLPQHITNAIETILAAGDITKEQLKTLLRRQDTKEDRLIFLLELAKKYRGREASDEATRVFREDWYGNTFGSITHILETIEDPALFAETSRDLLTHLERYLPRTYYSDADRQRNIAQNVTDAAFDEYFPPELQEYAQALMERIKKEVIKGRTIEQLRKDAPLTEEIYAMEKITQEALGIHNLEQVQELLQERKRETSPPQEFRRLAS